MNVGVVTAKVLMEQQLLLPLQEYLQKQYQAGIATFATSAGIATEAVSEVLLPMLAD